jgi:hypothetical protein
VLSPTECGLFINNNLLEDTCQGFLIIAALEIPRPINGDLTTFT